MKKTKLIALLLVIFMLSLSSISVYAQYDPTIRENVGGVPQNQWTVTSVYHWVVRGETLQGIATRYGTNIDEIKFYNSDYFNDLANRNKTTGLDIQLEPGVRLFIYHMVTVRHYVQRGDTLDNLANGGLQYGLGTSFPFTLRTTPAAIIAENQAWFDNLTRLNTTRNTAHELEESYDIWNVDYTDIGGFQWNTVSDEFNGTAGTPLYISVPVQIRAETLAPEYNREWYYIMLNNGEREGNPTLERWIGNTTYSGPQIPFSNTLPTNAFPNANVTRAVGDSQKLRLTNYKISGWAGIRASDEGVWW